MPREIKSARCMSGHMPDLLENCFSLSVDIWLAVIKRFYFLITNPIRSAHLKDEPGNVGRIFSKNRQIYCLARCSSKSKNTMFFNRTALQCSPYFTICFPISLSPISTNSAQGISPPNSSAVSVINTGIFFPNAANTVANMEWV